MFREAKPHVSAHSNTHTHTDRDRQTELPAWSYIFSYGYMVAPQDRYQPSYRLFFDCLLSLSAVWQVEKSTVFYGRLFSGFCT